jgi:hypothetical protein
VALRDLFASVGAGERCEEYAETFALELELECQLRPCAAVEWFDGDGPEGADGSVDASKRAPARRVMLGDLVADVACTAGQAAFVGRACTDPRRAVGLDLDTDDLLLPFAVLAQIIEIREDVFGTAVDLDAVNDRCHSLSSPHR